jgi:hypothetical protein
MKNYKNTTANMVIEEFNQAIQQATQTVKSKDDFLNWFRANWQLLALRGYYCERRHRRIRIPNTQLVTVKWDVDNMGFYRNSHSCPRGGVINFINGKGDTNKPTGYMGWRGYMSWRYTGNDPHYLCGADMFRDTIIHTGSGGGGDGHPGYEVTLWADDWPAWKLAEEQREMWKTLKRQDY